MTELQQCEKPITDEHWEISRRAWSAFRSKSPKKWRALLDSDTSILPFLEGAVLRQLEEYPDCSNGLSRSEKQILTLVLKGESNPLKVFAMSQKFEERLFMGDSSFWVIIKYLLKPSPKQANKIPSLLELPKGMEWTMPPSPEHKLMITPLGKAILAGEENWLSLIAINRWIGGVQLTPENEWCWQPSKKIIERRVKI